MKIYFYRPEDDQFWIGCSKQEAELFFLPRMTKKEILKYLSIQGRRDETLQKGDELYLKMYGVNSIKDIPQAFFNVSRDLSICYSENPVFPWGSGWNGYNPFCECDRVCINDPSELLELTMTYEGKPFTETDTNNCNMTGKEQTTRTIFELEQVFAQAAGIDIDTASKKDSFLLSRLAIQVYGFGESEPMDPEYICQKLRLARETGKRVRIVRDRKPWDNDPNMTVLDGESFHLEVYTPRTKK